MAQSGQLSVRWRDSQKVKMITPNSMAIPALNDRDMAHFDVTMNCQRPFDVGRVVPFDPPLMTLPLSESIRS